MDTKIITDSEVKFVGRKNRFVFDLVTNTEVYIPYWYFKTVKVDNERKEIRLTVYDIMRGNEPSIPYKVKNCDWNKRFDSSYDMIDDKGNVIYRLYYVGCFIKAFNPGDGDYDSENTRFHELVLGFDEEQCFMIDNNKLI